MMCGSKEGCGKACGVHKLAWVLVLVGALNWGLVAINPGYDLVAWLLGMSTTAARVVYGLVGISALVSLTGGKCCMKGGMCGSGSCKGEGSCKGAATCSSAGQCDGKK